MVVTFLLYHFIIFPRNQRPVLKGDATALYNTICSTLNILQCKPVAVNGTEDHIHIATISSPLISADDLMEEVWQAATELIENKKIFPLFEGWDRNYVLLGYSPDQVEELTKEVEDQKLFHRMHSFETELRSKGVPL